MWKIINFHLFFVSIINPLSLSVCNAFISNNSNNIVRQPTLALSFFFLDLHLFCKAQNPLLIALNWLQLTRKIKTSLLCIHLNREHRRRTLFDHFWNYDSWVQRILHAKRRVSLNQNRKKSIKLLFWIIYILIILKVCVCIWTRHDIFLDCSLSPLSHYLFQ